MHPMFNIKIVALPNIIVGLVYEMRDKANVMTSENIESPNS